MGYTDNLHKNRTRPNCWGNPDNYDQYDEECSGCRYNHSCRSEVEKEYDAPEARTYRTGRRPTHHSNRNRHEHARGGVEVIRKGELVKNENGFERFLKDAAAGALRGCFFEMYEFWKYYRFK